MSVSLGANLVWPFFCVEIALSDKWHFVEIALSDKWQLM
jgi:hypothetical protein